MALSRSMAVVTVADEGAGLPAGVGIRGRSDRGSTGLGLDIARRASDAGGGHLRLGSTVQGGARIELWLVPLSDSSGSQVEHSKS